MENGTPLPPLPPIAGFGHAILTGRGPGTGDFKTVPKVAEEAMASSCATSQEILVLVQGW